jgi:hypothetical protein
VFGTFTVPATFLTNFIPMILGLLMIDFRTIYFAAICKAMNAEILAASSSSGVSMIP